MTTDSTSGGSSRRILSLLSFVVGALLLLIMPSILVYFAVTGTKSAQLPGTLVILTTVGGMALIMIGAALRE